MSGSGVKGHIKRVVQAPSYHVHSKYDLHGLRELIHSKKNKQGTPVLPLTPMLDMMSILIIFLLMNFSATGEIFFVSKEGLKMPDAAHARPLESGAVVSIVGGKVYFDAEKMADQGVQVQANDEDMRLLRTRLQQLRNMEEVIRPGQPFKGMVNIQSDENTPLIHIKRVMAVLISEGWTGINFTVNPSGGGNRSLAQEEE